ncbi:hypothetical protein [Iodobacter fluviatilis]|uniref:Uncharacterized protein n=1 Tax=Iodobacter fluviatilis TaxID=537 RepID=A0A7G3GAH8_9NEIS|nr:hypothetical protein [Iodobacter fluviatilis]QBC44062.1 hypothetical protein C1H71_11330 [Iodobacter fluviatilis]
MAKTIKIFDVTCMRGDVATGVISDELYANSRHQLKVRVSITLNAAETLSETEKNSIKIVEQSSSTMPAQWVSSKTNTGYTQGLLTPSNMTNQGLRGVLCEPALDGEEIASQNSKTVPEVFYFYLSCDDPTLDTKNLVAFIHIDGGSDLTSGDLLYNKVLTIKPKRPYTIDSTQLISNPEQLIYNNPMGKEDEYSVSLFTWTLPWGLRFFSGSSSYVITGSEYPAGTRIWSTTQNEDPIICHLLLEAEKIDFIAGQFATLRDFDSTHVTVPYHNNTIRASKAWKDGWYYSEPVTWLDNSLTIIDIYGCKHAYVLYDENYGHYIRIRNI